MKVVGATAAKRIAVLIIGWLLILLGLAALVLPGPGLLALFAGLAVLSTQYEWAERRLEPVRKLAHKAAADSVATPLHIVISLLGAGVIISVGVMWGVHPAVPNWWPLADKWWLPGGWGTGGSLIGSGIIAIGLIVYSYINFRPTKKD
jgi:uncharacterized protein (TIGR02611 family)